MLTIILLFIALLHTPLNNALNIVKDVSPYSEQNFNTYDIGTNGEEFVIKHFTKENDIIFDVGASKGDWTACARKHTKNSCIYAFEPIFDCYTLLRKKIEDDSNIHAFCVAFSNEIGHQTLYYYAHNEKCSGLWRRPALGHVSQFLKVPITTIDQYCYEYGIDQIDFLNISTEGAELKVLQGAVDMISKKRIRYIQFKYGSAYFDANITFKELFDILTKAGYTIFRELPESLIRITTYNASYEHGKDTTYLAMSELSDIDI